MNNKFASIKTTDELDAAIRELHRSRERQQKLLKDSVRGIREYYKPANLAMNLMQGSSIGLNWTKIGLGLVRGLKKRLSK